MPNTFKLLILTMLLILLALPISAKEEVPKNIVGVAVITEEVAVERLITQKCLQPGAANPCIFVDPRKKKDLKRGIIRGSVLYECKKKSDFDPDEFLAILQKKGYSFKSYDDIANIEIMSGCNGKFCPRSHNLLSALREHIGEDQIVSQNIKITWVREKGVPGILKATKGSS